MSSLYVGGIPTVWAVAGPMSLRFGGKMTRKARVNVPAPQARADANSDRLTLCHRPRATPRRSHRRMTRAGSFPDDLAVTVI